MNISYIEITTILCVFLFLGFSAIETYRKNYGWAVWGFGLFIIFLFTMLMKP